MKTIDYKIIQTQTHGRSGAARLTAQPLPDALRGTARIAPGALTRAVEAQGVKNISLLWQHDLTMPIGSVGSLMEDRAGTVYVALTVFVQQTDGYDGVDRAREVWTLLLNQVVDGLSIGYLPARNENDIHLLTLSLHMLALPRVAQPRSRSATTATRAAILQELRTARAFLREVRLFRR